MQKIAWNSDWDFYEAPESNSFSFGVPDSVKVDLPHDFIISKPRKADAPGGAGNGYFGDGEGVYRKELVLPKEWEGKRVLLDVDGAYMNAEVSVNKEVLCLHPYGYTPFLVDMTEVLRQDAPNQVKIITQSRQPSSRWYSGGGLYRGVSLWVGGVTRIKPWDLWVSTVSLDEEAAVIRIHARVSGAKAKNLKLKAVILEAENSSRGISKEDQAGGNGSKGENSVEEGKKAAECFLKKTDAWKDTKNAASREKIAKAGIKIKNSDKSTESWKTDDGTQIKPGEELWEGEVRIEHPHAWSLEEPYLYRCIVFVETECGKSVDSISGLENMPEEARKEINEEIKAKIEKQSEKAVLDTAQVSFGIRQIEIDAQRGFRLNGKSMKLKGGCIHHDNGFVGAAAFPEAEERKIRILKQAGYNTVRISHNPPSLALLEACDRLGMLVLDEAFDVWRLGKVPMDYHLYFEDWWSRDIAAMVERDRSHPSVISYSIGNEISESNGKNHGVEWAKRLSEEVRKYDTTRPVLSAICAICMDKDDKDDKDVKGGNLEVNLNSDNERWAAQTADYCALLDIVGYNYLPDIYESSHEMFPERVILATETRAIDTYDYWKKVEDNPYVIGDCIWAAVDYFGEAGVGKAYWKKEGEPFHFMGEYPWRTSWQSDIDLTGEQRPQSVYRQIMWGEEKKAAIYVTHPKHYGDEVYGMGWHWYDVNDNWSFEDEYIGKPVKVEVYSAGEEVELFLNGVSKGKAVPQKLIAAFDIAYERGILEAVVYKNGAVLTKAVLVSAGAAAKLQLAEEVLSKEPDAGHVKVDAGQGAAERKKNCDKQGDNATVEGFTEQPAQLRYVRVILTDKDGVRLSAEERKIIVSVEGAATLLGMGSANPCTEDPITENWCHLYRGSALLILHQKTEGSTRVKVCAEGLPEAVLELESEGKRQNDKVTK